jgi:hypothetical protein
MPMPSTQIQYLVNNEIDKVKWDACISNASNGVIYGYSFFLDHMADQWDALVWKDYEAVMPLPWRKKYGIKYAYQPYFTAQGGIFFTQPLSAEITSAFIGAIPDTFKYLSLHLNEMAHFSPSDRYKLQLRTNYVLPLQQPYEVLYKNYTEDARKNLRRAEKFQTVIRPCDNVAEIIQLYRQQYGKLNHKVDNEDYDRLQKLVQYLFLKKWALCYQVFLDNEMVAAAIFLKDTKRLYYILGAPTAKGRQTRAIYSLINFVIKSHASSGLALDFEGSDIDSVADFYVKFGPQKKSYQQFIYNRLPFFLRWLKP